MSPRVQRWARPSRTRAVRCQQGRSSSMHGDAKTGAAVGTDADRVARTPGPPDLRRNPHHERVRGYVLYGP